MLNAASTAFSPLAVDPAAFDEVKVALLIDEILTPKVDSAATQATLDAVIERALNHPGATAQPWLGLAALGFQGNTQDYQAPDNSSLSWVLQQRRGIPITLAIVLLAVARAAGCHAQGLNHPGHFLVRVDQALVDPFQMDKLSPSNEQQSALNNGATPRDLAVRMLNNLKHGALQRGDLVAVLELLDVQLSIYPKLPEFWFEKAILWQRLGSHSSASQIFIQLLAEPLSDPLRQAVQQRLDQIDPQQPEIVH